MIFFSLHPLALCQDIFDKPQALIPCLHTFCLGCVSSIPTSYGHDNLTCPICRRIADSFASNFSMQNFIDIFNNASLHETEEIEPEKIIINRGTNESSTSITGTFSPLSDLGISEDPQQDEAESSNAAFSTATSSSSASSYQSVSK